MSAILTLQKSEMSYDEFENFYPMADELVHYLE